MPVTKRVEVRSSPEDNAPPPPQVLLEAKPLASGTAVMTGLPEASHLSRSRVGLAAAGAWAQERARVSDWEAVMSPLPGPMPEPVPPPAPPPLPGP